ncbi:hypothetical protein K437DRAFT_259989 [Tilletiaria anomala UBC 951]|uniref:Uncharacterized protein n=1 Tax=Tilletiaria anomala (strain ATCC 24038 / CBS 436.72 / UBC 951) TaxID=1037660 RepID=A0A066VEA2_TILAU|nr:uncharacterized protein K437DRAFT_259989 [Tilletiaria anomala UBC 951]KDN36880.1 hypothetical protein K437DRAFT_259989 [Tilletiaria anomala UBC 951]
MVQKHKESKKAKFLPGLCALLPIPRPTPARVVRHQPDEKRDLRIQNRSTEWDHGLPKATDRRVKDVCTEPRSTQNVPGSCV